MNSMCATDKLYKCEFCGVANVWDFMYWVQGRGMPDDPNCCWECVEDEDDSEDESDDEA